MKFSICIESVFRGVEPTVALDEIKAAGFDAFEFWGWKNKDIDGLAKKARELSLSCVCFCVAAFNLTDPGQRETFVQGMRESVAAAKVLGAPFLITQSGNDTGAERQFQHRSIVEGLKAAAPILEDSGVTLLLEPLNGKINHPGIYLESSDEGFALVDEAGSPNIRLLFDIYHQQITEGDIIRRMTANIAKIAHVHCAGNPGRNELDSGELDYRRVLAALEKAGYAGYAGAEYTPVEPAAAGLKRLKGLFA